MLCSFAFVSYFSLSNSTFMKPRLLFLFLLICLFIIPAFRAQGKAELEIHIRDSRPQGNSDYLVELTVLKNGEFFKLLEPGFETDQQLNQLEKGTYTFQYTSIFGLKEEQKLEITENKKYELTLYPDYLDHAKQGHKAFIDQLEEIDTYDLVFASRGCFHNTMDTISFSRRGNEYEAFWDGKSKALNAEELDYIRKFEIEFLAFAARGGCTTSDTYIFLFKGQVIGKFDDTCDWHGAYYLKKKLFGTE